MRYAFVLCLTLLMVLPFTSSVAAVDDESEKTGDIREFIAKKWPGLFQGIESDKTVKMSATENAKKQKGSVQAAVKMAIAKLEQRQYQYLAFVDKLRSRRDKLAADGKNVEKIDDMLEVLDARYEELKDIIQSEKEWMSTLDPQDTSAVKWEEAKAHILTVKKIVNTYHAESIKIVKQMREETSKSSSSKPLLPAVELKKKVIPSGYVVPPPRYKNGEDN